MLFAIIIKSEMFIFRYSQEMSEKNRYDRPPSYTSSNSRDDRRREGGSGHSRNKSLHATETYQEEEYERGHWGSKAEFLLSCIGYSVGIGRLSPLPPPLLSLSCELPQSLQTSSPLSSPCVIIRQCLAFPLPGLPERGWGLSRSILHTSAPGLYFDSFCHHRHHHPHTILSLTNSQIFLSLTGMDTY